MGLSSLLLPPHLGPASAVRGRGIAHPLGVWMLNSHWGLKANLRKKKKNSDDRSPQGISDMSFLSHSPLAPFTAFMKGYKVG